MSPRTPLFCSLDPAQRRPRVGRFQPRAFAGRWSSPEPPDDPPALPVDEPTDAPGRGPVSNAAASRWCPLGEACGAAWLRCDDRSPRGSGRRSRRSPRDAPCDCGLGSRASPCWPPRERPRPPRLPRPPRPSPLPAAGCGADSPATAALAGGSASERSVGSGCTGICWRVSFSMSRSRPRSSPSQKLMAAPLAPARAVRPMRCT